MEKEEEAKEEERRRRIGKRLFVDCLAWGKAGEAG